MVKLGVVGVLYYSGCYEVVVVEFDCKMLSDKRDGTIWRR